MKILIAEDDPVAREKLETLLRQWGHEVFVTQDGAAAWQVLQRSEAPSLIVADVQMPEMTGTELCARIRTKFPTRGIYVILLTATRISREDLIDGLLAGADDYVCKPFDIAELQARIKVGERVLNLQDQLRARVTELEEAMQHITQLRELLPICCYCKKIRDDQNYWHQVDAYITRQTGTRFSHGICPDCVRKLEGEMDNLQGGKD